jgi:hypothetical protein
VLKSLMASRNLLSFSVGIGSGAGESGLRLTPLVPLSGVVGALGSILVALMVPASALSAIVVDCLCELVAIPILCVYGVGCEEVEEEEEEEEAAAVEELMLFLFALVGLAPAFDCCSLWEMLFGRLGGFLMSTATRYPVGRSQNHMHGLFRWLLSFTQYLISLSCRNGNLAVRSAGVQRMGSVRNHSSLSVGHLSWKGWLSGVSSKLGNDG